MGLLERQVGFLNYLSFDNNVTRDGSSLKHPSCDLKPVPQGTFRGDSRNRGRKAFSPFSLRIERDRSLGNVSPRGNVGKANEMIWFDMLDARACRLHRLDR